MSLPWLVAVPKPHIHYARDHYWKYLIHILCLSASKAKGFIGVKWNWDRVQASSQQKEKTKTITALCGCKAVSAPSCSCQAAPVARPKTPLSYGLWVWFLKPELRNASDTHRSLLLSHAESRVWRAPGQCWGFVECWNGHRWSLSTFPNSSTVGGLGMRENKGGGRFVSGILQHFSNFLSFFWNFCSVL